MKRLLLFCSIFLTACVFDPSVLSVVPPVKAKASTLDKTTQKGKIMRYLCKDEKEVKVVQVTKSSKNTKKVKTDEINLTFDNVTQKLSATLSQTGKSYTNIHWHWFIKAGGNTLLSSVGNILAEECIEHH